MFVRLSTHLLGGGYRAPLKTPEVHIKLLFEKKKRKTNTHTHIYLQTQHNTCVSHRHAYSLQSYDSTGGRLRLRLRGAAYVKL